MSVRDFAASSLGASWAVSVVSVPVWCPEQWLGAASLGVSAVCAVGMVGLARAEQAHALDGDGVREPVRYSRPESSEVTR